MKGTRDEDKLSTELFSTISKEIKGLGDLSDVSVSLAHDKSSNFFVQIWSSKWNSFIDLKDVRNVSGGDRLKVVRRYLPRDDCSEKVSV